MQRRKIPTPTSMTNTMPFIHLHTLIMYLLAVFLSVLNAHYWSVISFASGVKARFSVPPTKGTI